MISVFDTISIKGIQAVVPEHTIDNMGFSEQFGEKKLKRLLKVTGVNRRHVLSEGTVTELAIKAADILLEKLKWNREEIRALVYVTQSPEFESPSTAMLIQKELKIGCNCTVFDINLGCSGYVAGLQVVSSLLASCEDGDKALLLVADDAFLERKELGDSMLFGDGAAATAIVKEKARKSFYMQCSDGSRYDVLLRKFGENVHMDGQAVFDFSVNDVAKSIREFHSHFHLSKDDIDYYVLHQAQKLIVESVAENADIPEDKLLWSLDEYGNTSCVSLPLTLCSNVKDMKKEECKVVLCGFGVGLSWGIAYLEIPRDVIQTVEYM